MKTHISLILILSVQLSMVLGVNPDETGCTAADCHETLTTGALIHSPVEDGECGSCHESVTKTHPSKKTDFVLTEETAEDLCLSCHDVDQNPDHMHPPVADGQCLSCHDPHHSESSFLMKTSPEGLLCLECHENTYSQAAFVHGPVAVEACSICHSGHGDTRNFLLQAENVNDLCYSCHSIKESEITDFMNSHDPVDEACTSCHNPHASEFRFQLEAAVPDLCVECHDDISDRMEETTSVHAAVNKDESCLNCHGPHGSDFDFNLLQPSMDLCLNCHDQPMKSGKTVLPGMKQFLKKNNDWHGPIRDKNCTGCHEPHGSANIRLLRYFYPPEFYSAFDLDNYQLCFQCHPETNVLNAETANQTNFRDGTRNLHFLHVNRKKGRTCRACHQTHASTHPYHIRDSVPFGAWELPVNYEPAPDGGSCLPGCHPKKSYTRTPG